MQPLISAFIFDLDGVIVDTARYHFQAWRRLAQQLGFDLDESRNEQLKGVGRMESLELLLEWGQLELPEPRKQELATQKNAWYQELIAAMPREEILPGVLAFLAEARQEGLRLAIGSGSKNAGRIVRQLEMTDQFDALVDGNDLSRSKPDPQVFQLAAQQLGLAPANCIVFEDAIKGVQAAQAGGFRVVGVGDPSVLEQADLTISGFEQQRPSILIAAACAHV